MGKNGKRLTKGQMRILDLKSRPMWSKHVKGSNRQGIESPRGEVPILWASMAKRLGRMEEFESWPFSYRTGPYRLHFKSPVEVDGGRIIRLYEAVMLRNLGSMPKQRPIITKTVDA